MGETGITVFGCEGDEADAFERLSSRFGIVATVTDAPVSERAVRLVRGNRCISVGHRSSIGRSHLMALRDVGVKYISTRSIGLDHIDMRAAADMGITVGNVEYAPDGVADYTVMLMLMALRNARSIMMRAEKHDFRSGDVRGKELRDMTVGVVGAGRIGKAVIERLGGFGCRVSVCDRSLAGGCGVTLDSLLQTSDIVTIHVPLNTDTYHIIGREQIDRMKPGAILVNTGRGALVDTGALVEALRTRRLGGAALDVLEGEEGLFYLDRSRGAIGHPFLPQLQSMENVIVTPHTAYRTDHALADVVAKSISNCLDFERGRVHV